MSTNTNIQRLPVEVDPFKLVGQGRLFEGRIPQQDFPRLRELLYSTNEDLVYADLAFTRTENELPAIKGTLKANLQMTCDRCLEATTLHLESTFQIVLVTSDAEAERLQDSFDTWLVEDNTLLLRDFIEDEILLAMPLVVMHDNCEPARALIEANIEDEIEELKEQRENPFAALKDLKLD